MIQSVDPKRWDSKELRSRFLDEHRRTVDRKTLNVVAHMLFEIDREQRILDVALGYLAERFSAGRVDIGFGSKQSDEYCSAAEQLDEGAVSMLGLNLPNKSTVLQRVWNTAGSVPYHDVRNNPLVESMKPEFEAVGIKALLAKRLATDEDGVFGIVCIDDLERGRTWRQDEIAFTTHFCDHFVSPLVSISRQISAKNSSKRPSPAELDAIRLAAQGLSYKQIAATLNKSIRTIEFQLRNARAKTGASNQTELVRMCEHWL